MLLIYKYKRKVSTWEQKYICKTGTCWIWQWFHPSYFSPFLIYPLMCINWTGLISNLTEKCSSHWCRLDCCLPVSYSCQILVCIQLWTWPSPMLLRPGLHSVENNFQKWMQGDMTREVKSDYFCNCLDFLMCAYIFIFI